MYEIHHHYGLMRTGTTAAGFRDGQLIAWSSCGHWRPIKRKQAAYKLEYMQAVRYWNKRYASRPLEALPQAMQDAMK